MKRITIGCGRELTSEGMPILPALADELKRVITRKALELFGGVTILDTYGAWRDDSGRVYRERGWSIQVLTDIDLAEMKGREFAALVRDVLKQQTVVFIVEDVQAEFI